MNEKGIKTETKEKISKVDKETVGKAVEEPIKEVIAVPRFSYKSLIGSSQFKRIERDLLRVLLNENSEYTVQEARDILEQEMKRTVE